MPTLEQMRDRIQAWAEQPDSAVSLQLTAQQAIQLHDFVAIAEESMGGDMAARQLMELIVGAMPEEFREFFFQTFDGVRVCRVCHCTDMRACEDGCFWVEEDLCSRCAGVEIGAGELWLPEGVVR